MQRREFITLLGGAAVWPLAAGAQPRARVPHVGFLSPSPQTYQDEFRSRMRELGYIDGQNVIIDYRFTDGDDERLPIAAKELAAIPVDVMVCTNSPATAAAIGVTHTIPIVMVTSADPLGSKFVASLARPGGNVTGLGSLGPGTSVKQLQFLKDAAPTIRKVVVFWNTSNPGGAILAAGIQEAARNVGIDLRPVEIKLPQDLETAFDAARGIDPDGIVVLSDQITIRRRVELVEFARAIRRPAVYALREFVAAGGLMSYGVSFSSLYYHAADYVHQIINGAKPADLPVQLPTKFELVINLKTAKALGVQFPLSVYAFADEVIE
jgi:putative ABC transport system substrate-binding protein